MLRMRLRYQHNGTRSYRYQHNGTRSYRYRWATYPGATAPLWIGGPA